MPLKPILDIELDDSKFKEFTKLYDKYQAQIKKLPEQWAAVNLAVGDNAESIKEAKDSAKEQSEEIKNQTEHAKKFHTVVKATRDTFTSINARSKNIEDSIFRATKHLARWSTLTAVVSGLTGGAALFGINKLVDLVASQRRQSMGLGISYGQNLSFNTNYQRLINPGSMLSNIATGKYTIGSPEYIAMSALGINGSEIANK